MESLFAVNDPFHRCEAGTDTWVQCNDAPVKICKYPVHGLRVGHSYYFRVRAVNSSGISRPSRKSDKVTALDAAESERLQGTDEGKYKHRTAGSQRFLTDLLSFSVTVIKIEGKYDIVIKDDDLEGIVVTHSSGFTVFVSPIFKPPPHNLTKH